MKIRQKRQFIQHSLNFEKLNCLIADFIEPLLLALSSKVLHQISLNCNVKFPCDISDSQWDFLHKKITNCCLLGIQTGPLNSNSFNPQCRYIRTFSLDTHTGRTSPNSYPSQIRRKIFAYFCFELNGADCMLFVTNRSLKLM